MQEHDEGLPGQWMTSPWPCPPCAYSSLDTKADQQSTSAMLLSSSTMAKQSQKRRKKKQLGALNTGAKDTERRSIQTHRHSDNHNAVDRQQHPCKAVPHSCCTPLPRQVMREVRREVPRQAAAL